MEQRRLKNYRVLMQARRQTQRMMREQEEALARLSDKSGGRPMKGSRRSGPVQEAVRRRQSLLARYRAKDAAAAAELLAIEDALCRLPELDQIVLRMHYIEGLTFEQIGQQIGYSSRQVRRIHEFGIRRLQSMTRA